MNKAELTAKIGELAEDLGIEVETEGLENKDLQTVIDDLEARIKARDGDSDDDDGEEEAEEKAPYTVAMGKGVTTKRGILGDGDEVTAKDFEGGMDTLKDLVKKGVIDKN